MPTLKIDLYPKSYIDNSERIKISELPSKSDILPPDFFFLPWEVGREEQSIPMKNDEAEMLRSMLDSIDSSISQGFRGLQGADSAPRAHFKYKVCVTAQEMRVWLLGVGLQEQAPKHLKLHW